MRFACSLLVLVGCGAPVPPERVGPRPRTEPLEQRRDEVRAVEAPANGSGQPAPAVVVAAPLARFAQAHEVYIIDTEGPAACQRWSVVPPNTEGLVELRGETDSLWLETRGETLSISQRSFASHDATQSMSCDGDFAIREVAGGLDLSGARWFDRAEDCAHALATKQPVAMRIGCEVPATLAEVAAARKSFETILRRGGKLWAAMDDACVATNVTAAKPRDGTLTGSMWTAVREGKLRGKYSYNYELRPGDDEIAILGPSWSYSDGSGGGLGCGDLVFMQFEQERVQLGDTHYLSQRACKRAVAAERASRSWYPPEPTEEDDGGGGEEVAGTSTPSLGGC